MATSTPTVTIPVSTLDKVSRLMKGMLSIVEALKTQAAGERFIPSETVLTDAEFEKMSEQLRMAFADLSEQELDNLVNEAVTWTRKSAP